MKRIDILFGSLLGLATVSHGANLRATYYQDELRRLQVSTPTIVKGSLRPSPNQIISVPEEDDCNNNNHDTIVSVSFTATCEAMGNRITRVEMFLFDGQDLMVKEVPTFGMSGVPDAHTTNITLHLYPSSNWLWYHVCVTADQDIITQTTPFQISCSADPNLQM